MLTRPFGNTGLVVSVVGFGAGHIGDSATSEGDIERLLHGLVDAGVTLFDTARSYGLSEERIGRHLGSRRSEIVLSTKIGYGIAGYDDWTGAIIGPAVERALQMLRTDVLDIVHLHSCPLHILKEGAVVEALQRCVREGKVRIAAYSGDNEEAEYAASCGSFGAVQTSVNLFDQHAIDRVLPAARANGLGVIAKRPMANAPWRFAAHPGADDAEEYWLRWRASGLDPGELPWDELALRFTIGVDGVSSAIVGSRNLEHMRANIALASKGPLPVAQHDAVRTVFQAHGAQWRGKI